MSSSGKSAGVMSAELGMSILANATVAVCSTGGLSKEDCAQVLANAARFIGVSTGSFLVTSQTSLNQLLSDLENQIISFPEGKQPANTGKYPKNTVLSDDFQSIIYNGEAYAIQIAHGGETFELPGWRTVYNKFVPGYGFDGSQFFADFVVLDNQEGAVSIQAGNLKDTKHEKFVIQGKLGAIGKSSIPGATKLTGAYLALHVANSVINNITTKGITLQLQENANGSKRAFIYCGNSDTTKKYNQLAGNKIPYSMKDALNNAHLYQALKPTTDKARELYIKEIEKNNKKLDEIGHPEMKTDIEKLNRSNNYDIEIMIDGAHNFSSIHSSLKFDKEGNLYEYLLVFPGDKVYVVNGKDKRQIYGLDSPTIAPAPVGKALDSLLKDMLADNQ